MIWNKMWFRAFLQIFIFMALPIIAFTFIANNIAQQSLLEQKRKSDLQVLRALDLNLSTLFDSAETLGRIIADDERVQAFISESETFAGEDKALYNTLDSSVCLNGYFGAYRLIAGASLMGRDGFLIGERTFRTDLLNYYFNPTFRKEISDETQTWSNSFFIEKVSSEKRTRAVSMITPVKDNSNALLGYVLLYIDTDRIKELLADIENEVYILEYFQTHTILASNQNVPFYYNLFDVHRINYGLLLRDSSAIVSTDTERMVVTTHEYPRCKLQFVLLSSYDNIKDEADRRYPRILIIGFYGVAITLLAAITNAKLVTIPVERLRGVMHKIMGGDRSVRYHTRSKDEIAELGNTFNSLLDEIYIQQDLKRRMQLQMIQEQVRPHFLYNVLEMISSLIRDGNSQESLASIQSLAKFYRISLSKGSDIILVQQEIQLIENYLTLQQYRYTEFMDYVISVNPSVLSYSIPKLTLQPILENAIYHGLKTQRAQRGILCVTGYLENDRVVFEVYDNGTGMNEDKLAQVREIISNPSSEEAAEHFGLASVATRLRLFCGESASFEIESQAGQYTNVTISFKIYE